MDPDTKFLDLGPGRLANQIVIDLPGSKSESNRAIVLQYLAGGPLTDLTYLSSARDTTRMLELVGHPGPVWDVGDAGTTCRFLTAMLAILGRRGTITGSARMLQRPIALLVTALRDLGADIEYVGMEGFLPLKLNGFVETGTKSIDIPANISSQYISALMMVAPLLDGGLEINLVGPLTSKPYLELTMGLMRKWGAQVTFDDQKFGASVVEGSQTIRVEPSVYHPVSHRIEADWSSASYWYSMVALSPWTEVTIVMPGLHLPSTQGDAQIATIMTQFGVVTEIVPGGLLIKKIAGWQPSELPIQIDCTDIPDMAQTFAVMAPMLGQKLILGGLHTLRIKETDRIAALEAELPKIGASMQALDHDRFLMTRVPEPRASIPVISTYQDHRMAMAFAPVAQLRQIQIEDPAVVNKSYPAFWDHVRQYGLAVSP